MTLHSHAFMNEILFSVAKGLRVSAVSKSNPDGENSSAVAWREEGKNEREKNKRGEK